MTPTQTVRPGRSPFLQRAGVVFRACLKQPLQVSSICPSSAVLTNRIADRDCVRNAMKIVELGPGTGDTTSAILSRVSPKARVMAIEMASEFIPILDTINDPRLIIQEGDAVRLEHFLNKHRFGSPDVILSGIPFSPMHPESATLLVETIYRVLRQGGVFVAYQMRGHLKRYAKPCFGKPSSTEMVWLNMPPLRVFTWTKN